MWIEGISLENFLRFDAVALEFSPGLNVVLAPNEGGKSSLFRGIMTALYTGSSSKSAEVKKLARWGSGGLSVISLDFTIGGAPFHLVRDFRAKGQQAIYRRGETGPVARGKAVDEFLGERLTLPDHDLFLRVCGVRHEELGLVGDGASIAEKIEEILGGGWGDMTPAKVRQTVDAKRKDLLRGKGHPAKPENWGLVRRLQERTVEAEAELERGTAASRRRAGLLASISRIDERLDSCAADLEILRTKRERALRRLEIGKKEREARDRAEEIRKRIDRIRKLADSRQSLANQGAAIPDALKRLTAGAVEDLRRALETESMLAREIEATPAPRRRKASLWEIVAGSALVAAGIAGTFVWGWPMLAAVLPGLGLIAWYLIARRSAGAARLIDENKGELERLRSRRLGWSGWSSLEDSKRALEESVCWRKSLDDLDARLEESAGGPDVDRRVLLERLDGEYGKLALEVRALETEGAALEPYRVEGQEIAWIDREIARRQEEQARHAGERAAKDREVATLDRADLSEIQERRESANNLLRRAERKVRVLDAIVEAVDEARGEMAGFLAERLPPGAEAYLSRITDGRYGTLFVDPLTMRIETVPAPDDISSGGAGAAVPGRVDTAALSQGARDQIYLAVRLALVDLLSGGEAQPVFLDDPFVHFDEGRRERALELVREFARTHQVILFTCDSRYRSLDARLIELPARRR